MSIHLNRTGVACANLNRDFIGIEKDLDYFNIALERIEKAHKDNAQAQWEFEAVKSNANSTHRSRAMREMFG